MLASVCSTRISSFIPFVLTLSCLCLLVPVGCLNTSRLFFFVAASLFLVLNILFIFNWMFSLRNHSKPHLRPTIPITDRSTGLLDNPSLFPTFPSERLNGVRGSPPTRLPTSQPRTRLSSTTSFPRRDTVGTGRVTEPTTIDYSLGVGRGR